MHVYEILGLAIPMHASTFPEDFPQLFSTEGGAYAPLKTVYDLILYSVTFFDGENQMGLKKHLT